jgi:cell division protein FtsW (lipid II flippase)
MKKIVLPMYRKITFLLALLAINVITFAQDKKLDVDISTDNKSDSFMMNPIVWIVGGAVFILLLVALLRNKK